MATNRRYSSKREAILSFLRGTESHPGAEEIYARLKPQYPDLSLGTVYRNIALFRESGDVVCVGTVDGQERYDADTHPHAHFICEKCGRVMDLDEGFLPEASYAALQAKYGFVPRTHGTTFYGRCADCAAAGSEKQ